MNVVSKELAVDCDGSADLLSMLSVGCCYSSCLPRLCNCDTVGCENSEQTYIHNNPVRWEILLPICRQGSEAQRSTAQLYVGICSGLRSTSLVVFGLLPSNWM